MSHSTSPLLPSQSLLLWNTEREGECGSVCASMPSLTSHNQPCHSGSFNKRNLTIIIVVTPVVFNKPYQQRCGKIPNYL